MMSFYGGTFTDYCKYCDDKYSGIFKLKKGEDAIKGFHRWLKEQGREVTDWNDQTDALTHEANGLKKPLITIHIKAIFAIQVTF